MWQNFIAYILHKMRLENTLLYLKCGIKYVSMANIKGGNTKRSGQRITKAQRMKELETTTGLFESQC